METVIADLIWNIMEKYGKDIAYFVLYVVSLTYIMVLRYKEQSKMLEVISALVTSDNDLRKEVHRCMEHSNLILSACIQSLSGNEEYASRIIKTLITPDNKEWNDRE